MSESKKRTKEELIKEMKDEELKDLVTVTQAELDRRYNEMIGKLPYAACPFCGYPMMTKKEAEAPGPCVGCGKSGHPVIISYRRTK